MPKGKKEEESKKEKKGVFKNPFKRSSESREKHSKAPQSLDLLDRIGRGGAVVGQTEMTTEGQIDQLEDELRELSLDKAQGDRDLEDRIAELSDIPDVSAEPSKASSPAPSKPLSPVPPATATTSTKTQYERLSQGVQQVMKPGGLKLFRETKSVDQLIEDKIKELMLATQEIPMKLKEALKGKNETLRSKLSEKLTEIQNNMGRLKAIAKIKDPQIKAKEYDRFLQDSLSRSQSKNKESKEMDMGK